jgi:L-alanine-DL-glutamate epimerase-like enolase superfamily enzyme
MKITSVESILLAIPFHAPGGLNFVAGQASPELKMLLVRVETDEGVTGWGEAFGHAGASATKAALDTMIAPQLIGSDPRDISALTLEVERKLHLFGRAGPVVYALACIDIALWDIAGKIAGQPLCRLLGGRPKELTVYSSFQRCRDPEGVVASCRAALKDGYRHVKLHEITEIAVRTARETLGPDVMLMVDANCSWSLQQAVEMARRLRRYDIDLLEEPLWPPEDFSGLARIRAEGVPVSAGENIGTLLEFERMFAAGAVDVVQPSVTKIGISTLRKAAALAEARNVRVVPHCGYLGPGYLATMHLVASLPGEPLLERLSMQLDACIFGHAVDPVDARVKVPETPGLGLDPDQDVIMRFRLG